MTRLSENTLSRLQTSVALPSYDRKAVECGIAHIGIGNFHRAHQAAYIDRVLASGDPRWGIVGISLHHRDMQDALTPQDNLYSLGIKSENATDWRIIGAVNSILYAPNQSRDVLELIASPTTRIISLTITEKAYCLDAKSDSLDEDHPDIVHDLAHPDQPISAIGYLVAGLKRRIRIKQPLPAILSCDNLNANGAKLRAALIRFAELSDHELSTYFTDHLVCPSTMIDRIVPQTTQQDRQSAFQALGVEDAWPVTTEPFTQWVMEDQFPLGRPDWEQFGVQCVKDVKPFERMKLSLLNASHSALAFLGPVAGYKTVSDAMSDASIQNFVKRFMHEDIAPTLALPAEMNLDTYIDALLVRFQNPALHHQLLQIASDSSQKIPQRFMPTVMAKLQMRESIGRFAYAIAGFLLLLEGMNENGERIVFNDPERARLISFLDQTGIQDADRLRALISHQSIFGELRLHETAMREILLALTEIRKNGVRQALQSINDELS